MTMITTTSLDAAGPPREVLLEMFEKMTRIRVSDERFWNLLSAGSIQIMGYYSARGQECIPAAVSTWLHSDDYLVTTYRGLHDMIAKGLPLDVLWAECLGKVTGTCKGKGGSMHITHPASGIVLTTGIVGGGLPIANGLALASQLSGDRRVTWCNFGDGASNIGAFHEALNLAALWRLPVVFVCQNNLYGEHSKMEKTTSVARIADRAVAYGMPGVTVDGNDPVEMWRAAGEAVERARAGHGPTLIEARTFRFWGHAFGDPAKYIPDDELAAAVEADPVPRYRCWLVDQGHASEGDLAAVEKSIEAEVDAAASFGMSSAEPDVSEVGKDVYAEEGPWPYVAQSKTGR